MEKGERDNRIQATLEEIPLKASITRQTSYWQVIGLEGQSKINTDTFHSWDICYLNVTRHLINFLNRTFRYDFNQNNIEHVSAEASYDKRDIHKIDIQPDLLPRVVFLYTHDITQSGIVNIPSMDQVNLFRKKPRFTALTVQYKNDPADGLMYNYMRDVSFALTADYRYNNVLIAMTCMVPTLPERIELAKFWNSHFPNNVSTDIYAKAPLVKTPLEIEPPVSYDIEAVIPREVENTLKKLFGINTKDEDQDRRYPRPSDRKLLDLLQRYSETPIDFKVIGGKGELYFVFKYKAQIIITAESVQEETTQINNLSFHQVRFQFLVSYTEISRYAIHAELTRVNLDNPKAKAEIGKTYKIADDTYKVMATSPIRVAHWQDVIEGTTLYNNLIYKVDKDDFKEDINGNKVAMINFSKLAIEPYVEGFMKRCEAKFGKSFKRPDLSRAREYFNIVAIRKKVRKFEESLPEPYGNTEGTSIDYENRIIKDIYLEENEEIMIGIYLNQKEYSVFLERVGFTTKPNLARETHDSKI